MLFWVLKATVPSTAQSLKEHAQSPSSKDLSASITYIAALPREELLLRAEMTSCYVKCARSEWNPLLLMTVNLSSITGSVAFYIDSIFKLSVLC